ncbi:hypothetical protein HMPREF3188_00878 [Tissierellia bacterium KA00581]|nr:hypothetical protein HMPREF3188_00878 [Tissierellia bacterium KA00581]
MENLTFTNLKEIAKVISIDDERVERLYIEQLENQSMSNLAKDFNILFLVKDLSFDDIIFEICEKFGEITAMFETTTNEKIIEYKVIYDNFIEGIIRIANINDLKMLSNLKEKYICVLNKNKEQEASVMLEQNIKKIKEDEFLNNTCEFFYDALKFANKLSEKEILNISKEYREMLSLIDYHLKHYVLSENKYLIALGKDDNLIFNYVENEIFEKYLLCYSKIELENLWIALFNMCSLFRKISLKIAINMHFEYAKELDRDVTNHLRELKQNI